MPLVRAEDERLFLLVNLPHENLHPLPLPCLDLNAPVEVRLLIQSALLDLALHHLVVGRVDVVVERRGNLPHLERRQEPVVDAVLQRVDEHRLAEIRIRVHVVLPLRRRRETELHGGREIVQDVAPSALIIRAAAMAFVNDDEVEEVRRVIAEVGRRLPVLLRPAHERLKDREEDAAVLRHAALLADVRRIDPHQRILGECGEGVVGLVRENVPIREEQDARAARRLAAQVPPAVEKFPSKLERDERLARARRQREQDALLLRRDGLQHAPDGDVLVVAARMAPALVLERHRRETIPPRIGLGEGHRP